MLPDDFQPAHTPITHLLPEHIIIALQGDTLLCSAEGLPTASALAHLAAPERAQIIGYWQQRPVVLAQWPATTAIPADLEALELRASYGRLSEDEWLLAGRASQIATFYRTHQHCGVCGHATTPLAEEVACGCPACGHRVWPRVSPAVMVLIRREVAGQTELLLARSPGFRPGVYSALAGFVEPGESLEQCAHREVLEEVGVRIRHLRWFGSQSWSFPHSLMLAFVADYAGGDIRCQPGEIEDAQWYPLSALPELPSRYSLAYRLIQSVLLAAT